MTTEISGLITAVGLLLVIAWVWSLHRQLRQQKKAHRKLMEWVEKLHQATVGNEQDNE